MGWDLRRPDRQPPGHVYTQNQCLEHPEFHRLWGADHPEFVVKLAETKFWIIEAKSRRSELNIAVSEAQRDYAERLNQSERVKAAIISGVAGNETETYVTESRYFDGSKFRPITINGHPISALVSPDLARTLLESNNPDIADLQIDEALFLNKAAKINRVLHLGAIAIRYRARAMAALLLATIGETQPNVDAPPRVLIEEINSRAREVLRREGKEEFLEHIRLALPISRDNHIKFKTALVETHQELLNLNIRSAMNSGTDVLGKFYEVFLKYGDIAKELGIVLTPRHITKFAAEVMNVGINDIILDPACGTGGFLVSAFDYVKKSATERQMNKFKRNNLFGIEQEPEVVSFAVVNMIFRGDGKNNIIEGNCFQKHLIPASRGGVRTARFSNRPRGGEPPVTKVLMNPPFALIASAEKEFRFVEHALRQMQDGGLLFSVLPYSAMVRPSVYLDWRRNDLLPHNTLLSVVTFPQDLFYPVGVHTLGIFVKKGLPHPRNQNVLWLRAVNDGYLKSKGKRLPSPRAKNDLETIRATLTAFLANPRIQVKNEPQFQKACPIDVSDELLELVPEAYLDQAPPTEAELQDGIEQVTRDAVAFVIKSRKET